MDSVHIANTSSTIIVHQIMHMHASHAECCNSNQMQSNIHNLIQLTCSDSIVSLLSIVITTLNNERSNRGDRLTIYSHYNMIARKLGE